MLIRKLFGRICRRTVSFGYCRFRHERHEVKEKICETRICKLRMADNIPLLDSSSTTADPKIFGMDPMIFYAVIGAVVLLIAVYVFYKIRKNKTKSKRSITSPMSRNVGAPLPHMSRPSPYGMSAIPPMNPPMNPPMMMPMSSPMMMPMPMPAMTCMPSMPPMSPYMYGAPQMPSYAYPPQRMAPPPHGSSVQMTKSNNAYKTSGRTPANPIARAARKRQEEDDE